MAAKEKTFVYTYIRGGSERTVKFATYEQAFARAKDDDVWGRAYAMSIDNTADANEETGFVGTEELHKRIKEAKA